MRVREKEIEGSEGRSAQNTDKDNVGKTMTTRISIRKAVNPLPLTHFSPPQPPSLRVMCVPQKE